MVTRFCVPINAQTPFFVCFSLKIGTNVTVGDVVAHLIFYYRKSNTISTANAYENSATIWIGKQTHNNEVYAVNNLNIAINMIQQSSKN